MARQFLADNSFYLAAFQDDGSSEIKAIRCAEEALAEIKPALIALFEDELKTLTDSLQGLPPGPPAPARIDAIAHLTDRIIDVAETLGYPSVSCATRKLREACKPPQASSLTAATLSHHRSAIIESMAGRTAED